MDEQAVKSYKDFMYNVENICNCAECPANEEMCNCKHPCGQQYCWVEVHCNH